MGVYCSNKKKRSGVHKKEIRWWSKKLNEKKNLGKRGQGMQGWWLVSVLCRCVHSG